MILRVINTKLHPYRHKRNPRQENISLNCKLERIQFLLLKYKISIFIAKSDISELAFDRLLQNRMKTKKEKKREGEIVHHALNVS